MFFLLSLCLVLSVSESTKELGTRAFCSVPGALVLSRDEIT